MSLVDALRDVPSIEGWNWARCKTRMDPLGWSYTDVLASYLTPDTRAADIGTGGGEIFSEVARARDVALDIDLEKLKLAQRALPCPVIAGDQERLPFRFECVDVVADRHVGVDPDEVLRILRPGGVYVTHQVGGRICQSIFDALGWGSNEEYWRKRSADEGRRYWDIAGRAEFYASAGCEILRCEEADVAYEFLDEASLAFWLLNAPLPSLPDPESHRDVIDAVPLKTNWHAQLLVVRKQ
jgi:SAM-dependent methyltransferase